MLKLDFLSSDPSFDISHQISPCGVSRLFYVILAFMMFLIGIIP